MHFALASFRVRLRSVRNSRALTVSAGGDAEASTKPKQKQQQQQQGGGKQGGGGKKEDSGITPRAEDFSKWYLDIVRECELAGACLRSEPPCGTGPHLRHPCLQALAMCSGGYASPDVAKEQSSASAVSSNFVVTIWVLREGLLVTP